MNCAMWSGRVRSARAFSCSSVWPGTVSIIRLNACGPMQLERIL